MKINVIPVVLLLVALIGSGGQTLQAQRQTRFDFGVGYLYGNDFFVIKPQILKLDASAGSPLFSASWLLMPPTSGSVCRTCDVPMGLGVTVSYAWFTLPDFGFVMFPDSPFPSDREPIFYRSVGYKLLLVEPNLLVRSGSRSVVDLGFLFAIGVESHRHESALAGGGTGEVHESAVNPMGGAGVGYTRELGEHFAVSLRGRLIVGSVTSSGYDLWIGGVNTGAVGGGTEYMKMVSLSLFYRIGHRRIRRGRSAA